MEKLRRIRLSYCANRDSRPITSVVDFILRGFQFDEYDRLDTSTGLFGDFDYDYDKVGNRTHFIQDAAAISNNYQPQTNRLTQHGSESILMDANGNIQNLRGMTLGYTSDNRLKSIDGGTHYQYNGIGQRVVKKTNNGNTRTYLYGQNGELLAEIGARGGVFREYIYINSKPLALLEYTPSSNEKLSYRRL